MQPNRINIFNPIHKALRALLYQTALHIQQTDFTNEDEAAEIISEVKNVVHFFEEHAHNEDSFILPAIAHFDKSISELFCAEHEEDERLGHILLAAASAWQETDDGDIKAAAGHTLFYHFNAFVAFNLYHMNKEETVLNNALWAHYSDEQIVCILQGLLATIPMEAKVAQSRWMLRGMNNIEIIRWLQQVKAEAPLQVFNMHINMAEEELDPISWSVINTSLADAVMVS